MVLKYINIADYKDYQHGFHLKKKRLYELCNKNYLSVHSINNKQCVLKTELSTVSGIEFILSKDYIVLSTFIMKLLGNDGHINDEDFYLKVIKKLNLDEEIKLYNYLGKNYIHNKHVITLEDTVLSFKQLTHFSFITPPMYHHMVIQNDIPEIVFSDNMRLVQRKHWSQSSPDPKDYYFLTKMRFISIKEILEDKYLGSFFSTTNSIFVFCRFYDIYIYENLNNEFNVDLIKLNSVVKEQYLYRKNSLSFDNVRKAMLSTYTKNNNEKEIVLKNIKFLFDAHNFEYFQTINFEGEYIYYFNSEAVHYFLNNYLEDNIILDNYNINARQLKYLLKHNGIESFKISSFIKIINKINILPIFEMEQTKIYLGRTNKFYNHYEFSKHLNVNYNQAKILAVEEGLTHYKLLDTTFFLKNDVINLRGKREEIYAKYVPLNEIVNSTASDYRNFLSRRKPFGMERYSFKSNRVQYIIERAAAEEYLKEKKKEEDFKKILNNIDYRNPWLAFQDLILLYNFNKTNFKDSQTGTLWFEFVYNRLINSGKNEIGIHSYVNSFINSTRALLNFLGKDELSSKNSLEINFSILNENNQFLMTTEIYLFIRHYYFTSLTKDIKIMFEFNDINNPYKTKKHKTKYLKEIYDYETFEHIYEYTNNMAHLIPAIEDCERIMSNSNYKPKSICYSWLYTLMHMNNAWRHDDICNLPMVNLDFLGFNNFTQLKSKELSKKQIDQITNLILSKEFTVSKTNVTNKLYISNEIKKCFAYAYTLCNLFNREMNPLGTRTINFGNKNNQYSIYNNSSFFALSNQKIIFKNRKMNRTLLTIMYTLVNKNNPDINGIDISKRLRSHMDIETTHRYIKIPEDKINILSKDLFDKGVFGYIPDAMSKIIQGESLVSYKSNENLQEIKTIFKNIYNIEISSGFINEILKQKKTLIDSFVVNKPEKVFQYLNNLHLNLLPGKDQDFQCLAKENHCIFPGRDCADCILSVPNFYAISNITTKVTSNINLIKNHFNELTDTEKVKYANLTLNLLETLHYAIDHFGEESVLQFFENDKEGYILLLEVLDNVYGNKNLLDYSTYRLEGSNNAL